MLRLDAPLDRQCSCKCKTSYTTVQLLPQCNGSCVSFVTHNRKRQTQAEEAVEVHQDQAQAVAVVEEDRDWQLASVEVEEAEALLPQVRLVKRELVLSWDCRPVIAPL